MNSVRLLDKTRLISRLLHENSANKVVFNDLCGVLGQTLLSNSIVISGKGKILGIGRCEGIPVIEEMVGGGVGTFVDPMLNERFLAILSTKENVNLTTLGFENETVVHMQALVTTIAIAGERLGTLFLYKQEGSYEIDDIILSEYGATVVGLEMLRAVTEETAEENRRKQVVKSAMSTLSYSETEAMIHVFDELNGLEGVLVASRIADKVGITRSVIVNALRKFESAGVIESRSSGMKGTYIKVLNDYIYPEIQDAKERIRDRKF